MRRSLLNKPNLLKSLRQALVLFTLLLLPSAAWGGNYNSGTLDTTNKTWGVWKLSDATYSSPQYDYLSFSGAGTITLTLTRPDNTLELIKSITLEIGGTETSSTTTLKSAMIGTTDITSDFVITNNSSLTYTFQPTVPIEWSGDIVITLQGTNNSGSILGAYVQTVTGYGLSVSGVPVTDDNKTNILGDPNSTVSFTPAGQDPSATLTLKNNANITGDIVWNPSENTDLTINLSGNNTLNGTISTDENTNLSFTGSGSLAIAKESGYAITEFNTVSLATGLYLKSDWPGAYWDEDRNTFVGNNSALSSLTITSEVYYPIWVVSDGVSFTQVSGANKGNVFNDDTPKVSYDSDNNQLTLNNWECATTGGEFAIILGDQESFNIQLGGLNKIGGSVIFFAKEDASLALSTDDELKGSLTIVQNQENSYYFTNIPDVNITYSKLTRTDNAVTYQASSITVAGVSPDSEGKFSGISGVTFTPAKIGADQSIIPATLTLNGATINGKIEWNSSDNLTIALNGKNSIVNNQQEVLFISESSCSLNIVIADNAESATLKFASYSGSGNEITNASDYFSGFICSSVLNNFTVQVDGINYNYYTTAEVYPVTVAGRQVHNISGEPGNKDDILGDGKVKFDGSSSTLTLDNAKISVTTLEGYGIETSLASLTIDLQGTNSINANVVFYGIIPESETNDRNITITSSSTSSLGTLTLYGTLAEHATVVIDENVYGTSAVINEGTSIVIAKDFTGLTIAGTPVTSENIGENGVISGVSGITSGTVAFAAANEAAGTPATLTLNNASITGNIKFNSDLTVHLFSDNTITNPKDADTFYAFVFDNQYRELYLSTDETKPGTLKFVELGPETGSLTKKDYITTTDYNMINSGTVGDVTWKEIYSTNDVTPSYLILSLNKHYNLWKNGHQYHDLILDNNDGFVFDPEESTLTISSSSSSDYINSGLENLTIIVNGTQSMSYIAFGAPEDTQAEGITTGTLTITGKEDSESSSSINSLSLSNSGGVITGFSSVSLTLPMHVYSPENFTEWTASVTSATITDETYNPSWRFEHGQSYATYCDPSADIYLPSTITPSVITEISGSTVKTQALSYIPKGVPVLLSKTNNTATTATFSKNLLKFAESSENPVTASESKVLYVLYNDQFVKVTPRSEIYYAGYLDLTGVNLPANTRGLTIDGDDEGTTALREVRSEGVKGEKWDDGEWYTLQGRKFTTKPTKPGLYILNGKKVVIK